MNRFSSKLSSVSQRIQSDIIGRSLDFLPKEQHRVLVLTLFIGVVCGVTAVAFHLSIIWTEGKLIGSAAAGEGWNRTGLLILVPALGGLISGIALHYWAPGARGSGIPQVKVAYELREGRLPLKDGFAKFVISTLQIGSGASLGREGPTVQICASISSALGRVFALSSANRDKLVPVGVAAGIAAAFNAPIAAITFTLEEIVGDLDKTVLSGVIVAAAIAAAVERIILGENPVFSITEEYGLENATSLIFYAGLGCIAGGLSIVFSESLLRLRAWFQKQKHVHPVFRPAIGGLITGLLIAIALYWIGMTGVNGSGYEVLSSALSGNLALKTLVILCVFKLIATVFSYASGGAGGIFAPALFIGGMLGGIVGVLDVKLLGHPSAEIGSFALVGMGAAFAGIIRAPMTSVLIIFEMTGSYGLILPLMIANMTSYGIATRFRPLSIYESLLEQDGILLENSTKRGQVLLETLTVSDAINRDVMTLNSQLSVKQALNELRGHRHSVYPVVDNKSRFIGSINEIRLRRLLATNMGGKSISKFLSEPLTTTFDVRLIDALAVMKAADKRHLVVTTEPGQVFQGIVTMTDIIRTEADELLKLKGLKDEAIDDIHSTGLA